MAVYEAGLQCRLWLYLCVNPRQEISRASSRIQSHSSCQLKTLTSRSFSTGPHSHMTVGKLFLTWIESFQTAMTCFHGVVQRNIEHSYVSKSMSCQKSQWLFENKRTSKEFFYSVTKPVLQTPCSARQTKQMYNFFCQEPVRNLSLGVLRGETKKSKRRNVLFKRIS
jgi:hypothetical protein